VADRFGAEVRPPGTGVAGFGADGIGESGSQGLFEGEASVPSVGSRHFGAEVAPRYGSRGAFDGEPPELGGGAAGFGAEAGTADDRDAVRVWGGLAGATAGIPRSCDGCVRSGPAGARSAAEVGVRFARRRGGRLGS